MNNAVSTTMVGLAVSDEVRDFLRRQSTLTLATCGPDGIPAAADLYFVTDETLNLYFLSESSTAHARNVAINPEVAATVHAEAWDWRDIKGIQLAGACELVTGPAARAALVLYGRKFSFMSAFAAAITRHVVFRIVPRWARWVDNSQGFGFKQEWELA